MLLKYIISVEPLTLPPEARLPRPPSPAMRLHTHLNHGGPIEPRQASEWAPPALPHRQRTCTRSLTRRLHRAATGQSVGVPRALPQRHHARTHPDSSEAHQSATGQYVGSPALPVVAMLNGSWRCCGGKHAQLAWGLRVT